MKKKVVQLMLGMAASASVMGAALPCCAADATEVATEATTEAATEAATEAETETETEASDFVEGSALLSDYDYKEGELSENGWTSEFLGMQYVPKDSISMSISDNDKLDEYYKRNGEDKMVANSELVASDKNGGYLQMTIEVNPNSESAEDILERFKTAEGLDLAGKNKDMELAGKNFVTVSGVIDKERYLLGICTDQDDVVLAIKVKYADSDARKTLMNGFDVLEEEETTEAEGDTENVSMPEEFEEEAVITEAESETAAE